MSPILAIDKQAAAILLLATAAVLRHQPLTFDLAAVTLLDTARSKYDFANFIYINFSLLLCIYNITRFI